MLEPNGSIFKWTQTDQEVGNCWCVIAGGACVYSFPIWLYYDNVSRNQSKRWNKHYSFLFSAAGLPCALFQHKYNVHFLCTSNLLLHSKWWMVLLVSLSTSLFYHLLGYLCTYILCIPQHSVKHQDLGLGLCSWGPHHHDPIYHSPTWWQPYAEWICVPCWSRRQVPLPHLWC